MIHPAFVAAHVTNSEDPLLPRPAFHHSFLRPSIRRSVALLSFITLAAASLAAAQTAELPDAPTVQSVANPDEPPVTLRNSPGHILHDQAAIWTSPTRIRTHDLVWLVPLAGAEAAALATDRRAMRDVVTHDATFNPDSINASNILIGSYIAVPVGLFAYGHAAADDHAREAGILSGEALIDGVVVEQGLKLVFWRERPGVDDYRGRFFQSSVGVDSSFPSSHSVLAWAAAAELSGEFPSRWKQVGFYTAATAVSVSRVLGQQHFPGDVLAGAAAGWLVGHYVFRAHHHHPIAGH